MVTFVFPIDQKVELTQPFLISEGEITRADFRRMMQDPEDWAIPRGGGMPAMGVSERHPVQIGW